jgi:hypothetical protein
MEELNIQNLMGIEDDFDTATTQFEDENAEELEGLARRFGFKSRRHFFRPMRNLFHRHAKKVLAKATPRHYANKGQTLLFHKVKSLSTDTQRAIKNGTQKFKDGLFYIRREITGKSGIVQLFEAKVDKEDGITNFEKGRLPQSVNLMLNRLSIQLAQAPSIDAKTGKYAPLTALSDPAVVNGEVEVTVGNRSILRVPINEFMHPAKDTQNSPKNSFNLNAPELIKEGEDIQVELHLVGIPDNTNSNKTFIEVKFAGDALAPQK